MPAPRSASLRRRFPGRIDIPALILISAALIGTGLSIPAVETRALFWREEYSIILNMQEMSRDGKHAAATILAVCAVGYPAVKVGLLGFFWLFPFPAAWRWRSIQLLRLLGRWGMVDVMAMASIIAASMTIGPLEATPKLGLFLYASGILSLSVTGFLMSRMARVKR